MRYVMPVMLLVSLCACGTVHVPAPVGDAPLAIDAGDWEGTWCEPSAATAAGDTPEPAPNTCVRVVVVDAAAGVLDAIDIEDAETLRVHLGHIPDQPDAALVTLEGEHGYELVERIRRTGTLMVGWEASARGFSAMIDRGGLAGRHEDDDAWVESLDPAAIARIARDEDRSLFDWTAPWVLVRIDGR